MPAQVTITPVNARPTLCFDGEPVSAVAVYVKTIDADEIRRFAGAGLHLFTFPMHLAHDETFAQFDRMIEDLVNADPLARFFPRVNVEPPAAWLRDHPGEVVVDNFGRNYNLRVSFASDRWCDRMAPVFAAFVRHMESSSGDRIIGYHIAAGLCGEWFSGCGENLDFSEAGLAGFRRWTQTHYRHDLNALNAAWKTTYGSFEELAVPGVEARTRSDRGAFRDPRRRRQVLDYYRFLQETAASKIGHFAAIAKRETERRKIVGVFYGYTLDIAGYAEANQLQGCGHSALGAVLRNPDIDFIASPFNYHDRTAGGSDWAHGAIDSIALHGKLFYCEADTRTALAETEQPAFRDLKVETLDDSIEVLKRNFAYALCHSAGLWWMELTGHGWFNHPRILDLFRETQTLARAEAGRPGHSVAEIAVVVDEASPFLLADAGHAMHAQVFYQTAQLARIGAPYDCLLVDDLAEAPDYKLYLFLDLFSADRERIRAIHAKLRRNQAKALWLYAPGLSDGNRLSVANMERLTGIRLGMIEAEAGIRIRIDGQTRHPLIEGLDDGFLFGGQVGAAANQGFQLHHPNLPLRPVCFARDPRATILGTMNVGDRPAFVVRTCRGWTSIYSAVGALPPPLLRRMARFAGVHLYLVDDGPAGGRGDVLYANSRWLALCSSADGVRTIRLPAAARVTDVFDHQVVCNGAETFTLEGRQNVTRLFALDYARLE